MDKFDHIFIAPSNFDRSLEFYTGVLGWSVIDTWGGKSEPRGAIVQSRGGITVVLAEPHEDAADQAWRHGYVRHQPTLHLVSEDVDKRFGEIPAGDHVVIPPENTHWGTRWFVMRDPDNNLIAFHTPRPDQ